MHIITNDIFLWVNLNCKAQTYQNLRREFSSISIDIYIGTPAGVHPNLSLCVIQGVSEKR